jgi:GT2 family glycosyltransferase
MSRYGNVCIIIVNYRTADLAADCLHSIAVERTNVPELRALIADNASADGSVEALTGLIESQGWGSWARVIGLSRNGGFAYGNNAGIEAGLRSSARPDYLMLLNPDTVVRPGAVKALVEFMDATPSAGIAGSLQEDAYGAPIYSAHNAPSPLGELEAGARLGLLTRLLARRVVTPPPRGDAHACDWVSGAALILRREVIEQVGLLDEGFFLYFEEVDYCLRVREAGWDVWFIPSSRIVHLEGAATGIAESRRRRPAYWFDSRRRYFVKHYGIGGLVLADLLWLFGRATLGARRILGLGSGGGRPDPSSFTLDLLWGDLRALFDASLWNLNRTRQRSASS